MANLSGREQPQPEYINDLLHALEARDLGKVHAVMSSITTPEQQLATLAARSTSRDFALRTPLIAAAETGDTAIFTVVLGMFNDLSSRPGITEGASVKGHMTMAGQLEMIDMYGMTLLMHAAASGNAAVFDLAIKQVEPAQRRMIIAGQLEMIDMYSMTLLMHAAASGNVALFDLVIEPVEPAQLRKLIWHKDDGGMTLLMHVACCGEGTGYLPARAPRFNVNQGEDNNGPTISTREPRYTDSTRSGAETKSEYKGDGDEGDVEAVVSVHESPDPWVPVIRAAFAFAKAGLWLPEYRKLMTARDCWNRSVIEHSILSGRRQAFEAVFHALRKNVHDETIALILGVGEGDEVNTMRNVLESPKGLAIANVVALKARQLKKDVTLRTEASTIAAKIQSFIPGNLIVIFQLLLPELDDTSNNPLYLLLALCLMAPFWAWGSTLVGKKDPELCYARERTTLARYFLSIPAMFFWGVGTSSIGQNSFKWGETAAAAALAVASIVIPAIDSFFSGPGVQILWGIIVISAVDFWDGITKDSESCKRSLVSRRSLRKGNSGNKSTCCGLMLGCVKESRTVENGNGSSSSRQSTSQNALQVTTQNASQHASQNASQTVSQSAWHSASNPGDRNEGGASSSDAPSSVGGGDMRLPPRNSSPRSRTGDRHQLMMTSQAEGRIPQSLWGEIPEA